MKKIIIIIICIFVASGLIMGIIIPKYQTLRVKQAELKIKNENLQNQKAHYEEVEKISQELNKYTETLSKIDSALPLEVSIPSLLDFLQKKSSESGLVLKQIGQPLVSVSQEDSKLKEYSLGISLTGSYSSLKNFLLALEKSSRIIEVENVSFSSPEKKNTPMSFMLNIKFYSY